MKGLPLLIGFTGPARSGKDSAADYIIKHFPKYSKASFADPLKDMLRVGLGLSNSQLYGSNKEVMDTRYGRTARDMMQTIGTEWGRVCVCDDIWIQAMRSRLKPFTIIPDVRFENEATFIREKGMLVHIIGREGIISNTHASEGGVARYATDPTINNDDDLVSFYEQLFMMFGSATKPKQN